MGINITYPTNKINGESLTDWKLLTSPVAISKYPNPIVATPIPKIR